MHNHDEDPSTNLNDRDLLAKESMQRDEFQRLEREQPQLRDTTYGLAPGSRPLVEAWERWWETKIAARARGLLGPWFSR